MTDRAIDRFCRLDVVFDNATTRPIRHHRPAGR